MDVPKPILMAAMLFLTCLPGWCQSGGSISEANKKRLVKDAVCFVNQKKGAIVILLFDRPLTAEQQENFMTWTGETLFGVGEVGKISLDYGSGGLPANPSINDPRVKFITLGNNPMFADAVRGSIKNFAVSPKGCLLDMDFKGDFAKTPLEYQLAIKAPVVLPIQPQAAPADLLAADKAYMAALAKAKSMDDVAAYYTSADAAEIAKLEPRQKIGMLKMMTAFDGVSSGKKTYSMVPKSRWVELVIVSSTGGMSTTSRRCYVQEGGQWKLTKGQ